MANSSEKQVKVPLGVGSIISESFSIMFRNFIPVLILAFVPTLLSYLVSGLLNGWDVLLQGAEPQFTTSGNIVAFVLSILITVMFYGVVTALLVQLAYDAKLRRPIRLGRYIPPALQAALPIAVLGIVIGVLVALACIALILPGLWVYAVFAVMAPAVVIERAGFGAMGRSANLTKEYRWPVLGTLIVIGICVGIMNTVATFVVGLFGLDLTSGGGLLASLVLYSLLVALGSGLGGISVALIYARLREIKEGISVDKIVSVFD